MSPEYICFSTKKYIYRILEVNLAAHRGAGFVLKQVGVWQEQVWWLHFQLSTGFPKLVQRWTCVLHCRCL